MGGMCVHMEAARGAGRQPGEWADSSDQVRQGRAGLTHRSRRSGGEGLWPAAPPHTGGKGGSEGCRDSLGWGGVGGSDPMAGPGSLAQGLPERKNSDGNQLSIKKTQRRPPAVLSRGASPAAGDGL